MPPAPGLLSRLIALRRISVLAQGGVLLLAVVWLRIPLPVLPMVAITVTLGAFNLFHSMAAAAGAPVTDDEVFAQLW